MPYTPDYTDTAQPADTGVLAASAAAEFRNIKVGLATKMATAAFNAAVLTWMATPTSANLRSAMTDESGSGALLFAGGALGTPASGDASNMTNIPVANATGVLLGVNGGTGVANSGKTLTLGGNVVFSGAFNPTIVVPASVSLTLPDVASILATEQYQQVSKSAAYTFVLADAGKDFLHPSADTTARVWTIPANSSVAYPIGTLLGFTNQNSAGVLTISITTDTMRLAVAGTTGSRTLAANGIAIAKKVTSTEWIISGSGLT